MKANVTYDVTQDVSVSGNEIVYVHVNCHCEIAILILSLKKI